MNFKYELATHLSTALEQDIDSVFSSIEVPPNPELGDFAFPCFKLAKELRKAPPVIAAELKDKLNIDFVSEIRVTGAYLNFFVDKEFFVKQILTDIIEKGENYGSSEDGKGKMIVIDYSSPNIAKPFHVGHLRSTVIGNALKNIYDKLGYDTHGINYLGDWGTQFGKLITAYSMWGNKEEVEKGGIPELNRLYVQFHDEAEKDESLNDIARANMLKMQEGDEEALSTWRWFRDVSLVEFNKVYDRLNITFDSYKGESFYNDKMDAVVDELREKNLLVDSNGARIVDLEEFNLPPCLILRSDGGTLYPTRDLAAAKYRWENFHFEKAIYITAGDQRLHFDQWFKVLEKMGHEWSNRLHHVYFGLVSLPEGKLSTRKGNVVLMEDLLDEAVSKTLNIINEKNPNLENKEEVAKQVGIGAVIFNDLYNSRIKDVVFSWERILNFDGETGPYVQYTHARARSVLARAENFDKNNVNFSLLQDEASFELVKLLSNYNAKLLDVAVKDEPFVLSRYVMEVARAFNKFYHDNIILTDDVVLTNTRLLVVEATANVIYNALSLLGIGAPNAM